MSKPTQKREEIKQIFRLENGDVEFASQKEFERYLSGEKPQLKFIKEGYYKAVFALPKKK